MGSGGKQKTSVNQTAVSTPNVPQWIQGPYQTFADQVNRQLTNAPDPSTYTTAANANQQRAWSMAGDAPGMGAMQNGLNGLGVLANYNAGNIQNRGDVNTNDVNYDTLAGADLSRYANPFTQSVIDRSLSALQQQTAQNIAQNQSQATASGSYGGSRHGVTDALTYGAGQTAAGNLAANLYSQNYDQARQGAMYDIGNRYQAGRSNEDARYGAAVNNRAYATGVDESNIQNGLASAGMRLNANNSLLAGGAQLNEQQRAQVAQLASMGENERQVAMQNNPEIARLAYLSSIGGLLGQIPTSALSGQTVNTTGTTTGSYSPGLLDWAQVAAQAFGGGGGGGGGKG